MGKEMLKPETEVEREMREWLMRKAPGAPSTSFRGPVEDTSFRQPIQDSGFRGPVQEGSFRQPIIPPGEERRAIDSWAKAKEMKRLQASYWERDPDTGAQIRKSGYPPEGFVRSMPEGDVFQPPPPREPMRLMPEGGMDVDPTPRTGVSRGIEGQIMDSMLDAGMLEGVFEGTQEVTKEGSDDAAYNAWLRWNKDEPMKPTK